MTLTTTLTGNKLNRRGFIASGVALATIGAAAPALALNEAEARTLITASLNDVNAAIASGKSGAALYSAFERIFSKYADVPIIAQSALGLAARQATPAQMRAYTEAYRGYLARKYGRRFNEFEGARFEVVSSRPVKSYFEVKSNAFLKGKSPFEVLWHVSNKSGKNLFFNIIIEGVNMLASERSEIGAMLDKRKGNIDALIADLKAAS
jgi:phospholipid transport system substrate-binding protein